MLASLFAEIRLKIVQQINNIPVNIQQIPIG